MDSIDFIKISTDYGSSSSSGNGSSFGFGFDYGNGNSCGFGSSFGFGYGSGFNFSSGFSNGNGYGYNSGSGFGSGIKSFNGKTVFMINCIPTIISNIKKFNEYQIVNGYILESDMTLTKTYIAKKNNVFAHGITTHHAIEDVEKKIFNLLEIEEKITLFLKEFNYHDKYKAKHFIEWHRKLTGSCRQGIQSFIQNKNINEEDFFSLNDFFDICKDTYGCKIINLIKKKSKH